MKFKIGKTTVVLSFWFFSVIILFLLWDKRGMALPVMGAMVAHESGHLLYLWMQRMQVEKLELGCTGIRMRLKKDGALPFGVSMGLNLSGCLANLFLALLFGPYQSFWAVRFSAINSAVAIFNLLPMAGLDGGAMIRDLCILILGPAKGLRTSAAFQMVLCAAGCAASAWWMLKSGVSLGLCALMAVFLCGVFDAKW